MDQLLLSLFCIPVILVLLKKCSYNLKVKVQFVFWFEYNELFKNTTTTLIISYFTLKFYIGYRPMLLFIITTLGVNCRGAGLNSRLDQFEG